jgi:hypothetical protein
VKSCSTGSRRGLNLMRCKGLVKTILVMQDSTGLLTIRSTELHEVQQTGFKGS